MESRVGIDSHSLLQVRMEGENLLTTISTTVASTVSWEGSVREPSSWTMTGSRTTSTARVQGDLHTQSASDWRSTTLTRRR